MSNYEAVLVIIGFLLILGIAIVAQLANRGVF